MIPFAGIIRRAIVMITQPSLATGDITKCIPLPKLPTRVPFAGSGTYKLKRGTSYLISTIAPGHDDLSNAHTTEYFRPTSRRLLVNFAAYHLIFRRGSMKRIPGKSNWNWRISLCGHRPRNTSESKNCNWPRHTG